MARAKMTEEIVETCYPLYDADMKALIAEVHAVHKGQADVEERLIDAIWSEGYAEFRARNIEASRGDAEALALAERGTLTPAGRAAIRAYLDEAQDYDEGLLDLSDAELAARYDEVCGPAEAAAQAKRRERGRQADLLAFFSRASATADFAHWRALPVWSTEEATALSFGKDPRRVSVATLRAYTCLHGSPFRDEFMARLDQIERGLKLGKPSGPLSPDKFLVWANRQGITVPKALSSQSKRQPLAGHDAGGEPDIHGGRLHIYYKIILGLAAEHYGLDVTLAPDAIQPGVYKAFSRHLFARKAGVNQKTLRKIVREALIWAKDPEQPVIEHARRKKSSRERA